METKDGFQLELFSQTEKQSQTRPTLSKAFLNYIFAYEKAILAIICVVIIGIVSFSLGVKNGRRLATKIGASTSAETSVSPQGERDVNEETTGPIKIKESQEEEWTVQVATYQTKKSAEKEAEVLKRKGLSPRVLSKGQYIIVCVGTFSNKEKARFLMSELKKHYRDCFIREL